MDARGNIYRAPEDEIPEADKERFDAAVLRGEAERAKAQAEDQLAAMEGRLASPEDGLTAAERVVSDHLVAAVNAFTKLEPGHPSAVPDFVDGIHACQSQLAWRIVQRAYPKAWPVKV